MDISEKSTIGEVVTQDMRTASVFKNHAIDFCCGGDKSIETVCEEREIDAADLIEQLKKAIEEGKKPELEFNLWPLDLLADYIQKKHHKYADTKILEIKPYLEKLVRVHGERHPELTEVQNLFNQTAGEMTVHMKKEELMIFPRIKRLVKAKEENAPAGSSKMGSISNSIKMMLDDHDSEGERFHQIDNLTHGYQTPEDGCNTYKLTMAMLKEFEEDLHMHIHLENNILFPKSIQLEAELA